ncbi:MAG: aminotransferase class V-fold PLP-dependent enzyme [Candidatus Omnitrophica bacterium]|nr:aminotransferase class V-fold PLP-dependent enzyme [Candidatus Omnitrophota bacterium]MCB9720851.1 aminotransferase class V-fold PLP-dependent enzyme [Candidatus Omnitrophota bacterium]
MNSYARDFHDFEDVIWLNAASEGPLPNAAKEALAEAVAWKRAVHQLDIPKFIRVPQELRQSIGSLMNVDPAEVILGNSASYGLHLLADGLPWQSGDDVLLMENDFPTDILPWLALEDRGVTVRQVKPAGWVLTAEEIAQNITPRTRVVCLSHVHTFSGHMIDAPAVAAVCRQHGILFVLNVVQSLGNRPVDVAALGADAVVAVGYKWLCGPYGTGFCWIRPEVRRQLSLNRAYWSGYLTAEELQVEGPLARKHIDSARGLDMFGTANFFNFVPLQAALQYWLSITPHAVQQHNSGLVNALVDGLDPAKYRLISPVEPDHRTNLVVLSLTDASGNAGLHRALQAEKIYTASWKGRIRVTPHVYNDKAQISRVLTILNEYPL